MLLWLNAFCSKGGGFSSHDKTSKDASTQGSILVSSYKGRVYDNNSFKWDLFGEYPYEGH